MTAAVQGLLPAPRIASDDHPRQAATAVAGKAGGDARDRNASGSGEATARRPDSRSAIVPADRDREMVRSASVQAEAATAWLIRQTAQSYVGVHNPPFRAASALYQQAQSTAESKPSRIDIAV